MHQVIDNVRQKCGSGIAIEIRLSGSELSENGYTVEEGVQIAKSIDGKIDLLHISAGTFPESQNGNSDASFHVFASRLQCVSGGSH